MELFPEPWQLSALWRCCFSDIVGTIQVGLIQQREKCVYVCCTYMFMCKWLVHVYMCLHVMSQFV